VVNFDPIIGKKVKIGYKELLR